MTSQPIELEGTWEEIIAHAAELAGRRVRVIVLPDKPEPSPPEAPPPLRPSSGHSLLRHAGTWVGEDFEACLQLVYDTRSQADLHKKLHQFWSGLKINSYPDLSLCRLIVKGYLPL